MRVCWLGGGGGGGRGGSKPASLQKEQSEYKRLESQMKNMTAVEMAAKVAEDGVREVRREHHCHHELF